MRITIIALIALALAGCATTVRNPQQVTDATTFTYDKYSGFYLVHGMTLDTGEFPSITKLFMRGGFKPHGTDQYVQIYVDHFSQSGWNFFDTASAADATPLHVTQINREVLYDGNVDEYVGIDLPPDYVAKHLATGFNIRLSGQGGSIVLLIPAAYVQGFMDKYRSAVAQSG